MAAKYTPAAHSTAHQSTLDGTTIKGVGPGPLVAALDDPHAPAVIWLPTTTSSDGFPAGMLPFATATATAGTVS
jgi:hypothetical protein